MFSRLEALYIPSQQMLILPRNKHPSFLYYSGINFYAHYIYMISQNSLLKIFSIQLHYVLIHG